MGGQNRKYHDIIIGDPNQNFQRRLGFDTDNLDIYKDPEVPPPVDLPEPTEMPEAGTSGNAARRASTRRQKQRRGRQSTILTSMNRDSLG